MPDAERVEMREVAHVLNAAGQPACERKGDFL
jgi:hypothetical protein